MGSQNGCAPLWLGMPVDCATTYVRSGIASEAHVRYGGANSRERPCGGKFLRRRRSCLRSSAWDRAFRDQGCLPLHGVEVRHSVPHPHHWRVIGPEGPETKGGDIRSSKIIPAGHGLHFPVGYPDAINRPPILGINVVAISRPLGIKRMSLYQLRPLPGGATIGGPFLVFLLTEPSSPRDPWDCQPPLWPIDC